MKQYFLLFILTMCFFLHSSAQKKDQKAKVPKEDIKVNREYDEQGKLIKFDSIYSYSWSGDTTLQRSLTPEDCPTPFGDQFGFFSDSTFRSNSFFDDLDQLFAQPFGGSQDSVLMKRFGMSPPLYNFRMNPDSLMLNFKEFDDFFNDFSKNKGDSISSGLLLNSQPKSMDEMMKMLQQQIDEYHRKILHEKPKGKEL
ncbi:MAG TPA: hypothetical protein VFC65_00465 [Prolixibacteraceae bacterium]|nr:hypothetical protein [Prolixibacteraceae bacterium]